MVGSRLRPIPLDSTNVPPAPGRVLFVVLLGEVTLSGGLLPAVGVAGIPKKEQNQKMYLSRI
jgi:hypothetical protein